MPTYFFNVHNGEDIPDREGTAVCDEAEARREATRYFAELLIDYPGLLLQTGSLNLTVTDETRQACFCLDLSLTRGAASQG